MILLFLFYGIDCTSSLIIIGHEALFSSLFFEQQHLCMSKVSFKHSSMVYTHINGTSL